MTTAVTIDMLARVKGLAPATLRQFGVEDVPEGVRIPYRTPEGGAGRARLRTALRGVDGSSWEAGDLPLVAYWHPVVPEALRTHPWLLMVEGESDCWTAWAHGFAAVGLPGSDSVQSLTRSHVDDARCVCVVVEPDNPRTYPDGVRTYVERLVAQLRRIGYQEEIRLLYPPEGADDVNAIYRQRPGEFASRLPAMVREASRISTREP